MEYPIPQSLDWRKTDMCTRAHTCGQKEAGVVEKWTHKKRCTFRYLKQKEPKS